MKVVSYKYTSAEDLLSIVHRHLGLAGWTINYFGPMLNGDPRLGRYMSVQKSGCFFTLRAFDLFNPHSETYAYSTVFEQRGIAVNACDGYTAGVGYLSQPGFRQAPRCYVETSFEGTCYLSYSGDIFIISTQYDDGRFSHVIFGKLPVFVAGTGGNIVSSTHVFNSNSLFPLLYNNAACFCLRINHAQFNGWDTGSRTLSSLAYPTVNGIPTYLSTSNQYGGLGTHTRGKLLDCGFPGLIPVNFFTLFSSNYSPFAQIPDLFFVPLDYVSAASELVIGRSKFFVIPLYRKGSWLENTAGINNLGIAVLKDE